MSEDLTGLLPYVHSERQREVVEAVIEHGSNRKAAAVLKLNRRAVDRTVQRVRTLAAAHGWSPDYDLTHPVAPGQALKGVSTYYDRDGNVRGQWVKSREDGEQREQLLREATAALADELPKAEPIEAPRRTVGDLANLYVVTDYHIGMKAWHEETGSDWDTNIAEELLVRWFGAAIKAAPDADVGIFAQLGDFLHWDGLDAVTPLSKHTLDADTRFQKLVRVSVRVVRRIVRLLLKKHNQVHLLMAEGNHDLASSAWLREMFFALYENEPRVTVDRNADPFYCYEHGDTSLFFHHGHLKKKENIDDVFVAKHREVFGRTKHSYAHMGHLHNAYVRETNLMVIEQHRTLATNDAYASRGGWLSGRDASVITYSKRHGQVGRVTLTPEMVACD